jgi:hypothetical protein
MLSWIPLLGPILQGLFSTVTTIYSKFKDTQVGMRQADVEEAKVSAQIIHDTADDIGIRIWRDIALAMPVAWGTLIGWDTIIGARKANGVPWHPWASDWMFHVGDYPPSVSYLPYVAYAFLFGVIGFNVWKRK